MERRTAAHLPGKTGSSLVAAESYQLPLLPYERQLIAVLGLSESEYRRFAEEVRTRGLTRPPGYEHIPDAQNGFIVPILINLAIGVALSALGALLAPKPKEPVEIQQRKLANRTGRTRFNQTQGFDAAPTLADLGARVPVPFGRYEVYSDNTPGSDYEVGETGVPSGGIVVEPLLVWSRMLSNGSFQSIKALAVIGQSGIDSIPPIQAVMIGGQPIANFYKSNYAFFWSSKAGDNRITLANLVAGDAAPDGNFLAPTGSLDNGPGFSAVYSPSNTASFGVYASIPNGGHYRVNWRVVSIPDEAQDQGTSADGAPQDRRQGGGRE